MYDGNERAPIDLIVRSHMNAIYERAGISHGFGCMLASGRSVFPRTIILNHMVHFQDSFKFDI